MNDRRRVDNLSVEELEDILYRRKRAQRQNRLRRLKKEGRLIEVAGLPPPNPEPPPLIRPTISASGNLPQYSLLDDGDMASVNAGIPPAQPIPRRKIMWRWIADKSLLLVETVAILGFIFLILSFLDTRRELNQELATLQEQEAITTQPATPTPLPLIDVVILPSGHPPPVEGRSPEPGEAGYVPDHLKPIISSYKPPPAPTPSPAQARRIQIPSLGIDKTIVQGDSWEQLKKGVGQHIGSALPGQSGNLVLSAHNDIYGEIFRHLDKLAPGDEIVVSTERESFVYVVRDIEVVEPTEVWVMAQTDHASTTLISCYPYLINNKRIVIFADLAELEG